MIHCKIPDQDFEIKISIFAHLQTLPNLIHLRPMDTGDQYNFSIFRPRNRHGRKNRNVILTILLILATAVFGFQILLRIVEKPVPEASLTTFEAVWPAVSQGAGSQADYQGLLAALLHVKGKNNTLESDKDLLHNAIALSCYTLLPDTVEQSVLETTTLLQEKQGMLSTANNQAYLDLKMEIEQLKATLTGLLGSYTGLQPGSLEATILSSSLQIPLASSFQDPKFEALPDIMSFYLTHNQSFLTDTPFLGFPFHYFYTAVFLLVLFVVLCIVYNILIERRLKKEHVVE